MKLRNFHFVKYGNFPFLAPSSFKFGERAVMSTSLYDDRMEISAGAQTFPMQKKIDAKSEFWSLQGFWVGTFQRGAQQKVVAGKNYIHRNYIAFLRCMGIRLSQEITGISSDLQISLGFECQVMATRDTTSLYISLNCFLYRGSQGCSHEIKSTLKNPIISPFSLIFG